jgi:hypothetical protein
MDNIDKDCITCYGTGCHIHVYSSGPFGIEPSWGGCVKCNPEKESLTEYTDPNEIIRSQEAERDDEDSFPISRYFEYYWVEIANNIVEIVAGIWSSSEAAETALKKFSEKPNWEYEDKTIIVLNRDCLRTLVNCNEFSYKD